MAKINVLVLFGGRSTEHDISIITGLQVLDALDKSKYNAIPIYVTKRGQWILGDRSFFKVEAFRNLENLENGKQIVVAADPTANYLIEKPSAITVFKSLLRDQIGVVFPAFHGTYGEDGSIQGLMKLANIAYVGCDLEASAIAMDKVISKRVAKSIGIPVLADTWASKTAWEKDKKRVLSELMAGIKFPVFVKPVHLGSTIGISKADNKNELKDAIEVVFHYDDKVMVEQGLQNARDINISILGNDMPYELSPCEEPIRSSDILSFEDKYINKNNAKGMAGAKRIIPAKIKQQTLKTIHEYSQKFFHEIGGSGISRIDFLLSQDESKIFFNEINPMPGSVSYYLWKEKGMSFTRLVDNLIELAISKNKKANKLTTTFSSNALSGFSGAKGKA